MRQFHIIKVFNNNVILARDKTDSEEAVLVGKGLGFGEKPGNVVQENKVEKIFYFIDKDKVKQLDRYNEDIIGITEEIISMVSENLSEPLNEHIHLALADHIGFTLERLETGLEIMNPFLEEIKALYPMEYELACKSASMIEEKFRVTIPEGEKGFIAMHIHSARINRELSKTVKSTSMINKMVDIIEKELQIKLNRQNTNYARLVIHLRFALDRVDSGMTVRNPLLARIKIEFAKSYKASIKIGEYIQERTGKAPPEDELGYLALHIQRIKDSLAEQYVQN